MAGVSEQLEVARSSRAGQWPGQGSRSYHSGTARPAAMRFERDSRLAADIGSTEGLDTDDVQLALVDSNHH